MTYLSGILNKTAVLTALLGFALLWSCSDKDDDGYKGEIRLTAPVDNAEYNLSNVDKITFSWTAVDGVTEYALKMSPDKDNVASSNVKFTTNGNSYELTAVTADQLLAGISVPPEGEANIYWTVMPEPPDAGIKTNVRMVKVKRGAENQPPNLEAPDGDVQFEAAGGEKPVNVVSNINWSVAVTGGDGWLTLSPTSGSGNGTITLTADPNFDAARSATLTFSGTGVSNKTITVSQSDGSGEIAFIWTTDNVPFTSAAAGSENVEIISNTAWTIDIEQTGNWLSVTPTSGTGNGEITLTVTANTGGARSAIVNLNGAGMDWTPTITVTQAGTGGNSADLHGTWYLKKMERIQEFLPGMYANTEILKAGTFTLLSDGTYTGEIENMKNYNFSDDGEQQEWTYTGGMFSFINNGDETTFMANIVNSELVFEIGVAGQPGYGKATYARTATVVPPVPETITSFYTGNEELIYGEWIMTKTEDGIVSTTGGTLHEWFTTIYNPDDEFYILTINPIGTYTIAIPNFYTFSGTWSFDPVTGILAIVGPENTGELMIDPASTATTLILVGIRVDDDEGERTFFRETYIKK